MTAPVKLGRLSQLGISTLPEVALFLPASVKDNSNVMEVFDPQFIVPNRELVMAGRLMAEPETSFSKGRPRTQFTFTDGQRRCQFSLFGDVRDLVKKYCRNQPICVRGLATFYNNGLYLNDAEILDDHEIGRIAPVYKGAAGKITAKTTAKEIQKRLAASIPLAAALIAKRLRDKIDDDAVISKIIGCSPDALEDVLLSAHQPQSLKAWDDAMLILKIISAFLAGEALLEFRQVRHVKPFQSASFLELSTHIPFAMTNEQKTVVGQMVKHIQQGNLLEGLLVGDVGTGKTVVYGILVAYFAWAGKRVAILLPNENLARQIHQGLAAFFPWMKPKLVVGSTEQQILDDGVLIGTTALLFRDVGNFHLIVCDEQQKMATAQREQLRDADTHLLEVSATPIPRSMALALYGSVDIYQLTKCHVEKNIITRIWEGDERRKMFIEVMDSVKRGKKLLVVCPKRETTSTGKDELPSVEEMAAKFESYCPGMVSMSHSGLSDDENIAAMADIKSGRTRILVATSVVEVGIDIPELERVVVVHPERFGLQQLHQIRGRVARAGGTGYCDLFLPRPLKQTSSYDRLKVLELTSDGFEIAEHDLMLRGMGDVSRIGGSQHGSVDVLIKNTMVTLKQVEWVVNAVNKYRDWKQTVTSEQVS